MEETYLVNGRETKRTYDANGKVVNQTVYDENEGDFVSYELRHENGEVLCTKDKNGRYLYYTYNADLCKIEEPNGVIVEFYVQDGVRDPEKAKKKREIT